MKKDIEFIKEILTVFENDPNPLVTHSIIMDALGYDSKQDEGRQWFNKYYHHINLLSDSNCILFNNEKNNGFQMTLSGKIIFVNAFMRITDDGHNMLIALNDDTVWKKLSNLGGKITAAALIKAGEKITEINIDQLFN